MRVLLDECVPKAFGRTLAGHAARTVPQEGWSGKKNGELLSLAVRPFTNVGDALPRRHLHKGDMWR